MAAAEARAACQRAVNRYLVQEDAKRAPKLARCPSSVQQQEASNGKSPDTQGYAAYKFAPLNSNPMSVGGFPQDTKWWLQEQCNLRYQEYFIQNRLLSDGYTCDQKTEKSDPINDLISEGYLYDSLYIEPKTDEPIFQSPRKIFTAALEPSFVVEGKGFITLIKDSQESVKSVESTFHTYYHEETHTRTEQFNVPNLGKEKNSSSDICSPIEEGGTKKPWWRITDEDELALLVCQKTMGYLENCDLPKPSWCVRIGGESNTSSADQALHCRIDEVIQHKFTVAGRSQSCVKYEPSNDKDKMDSIIYHGHCPSDGDAPERRPTYWGNFGQAHLLEALRHSQTRAREAEMAARQALDEKEHIVKVLLRQASHLFAYKQWLNILQLENLCLQLKDCQTEKQLPEFPCMLHKENPSGKVSKKKIKELAKNWLHNAVMFAVGFGISGAGLIIGWTFGWLFHKL